LIAFFFSANIYSRGSLAVNNAGRRHPRTTVATEPAKTIRIASLRKKLRSAQKFLLDPEMALGRQCIMEGEPLVRRENACDQPNCSN